MNPRRARLVHPGSSGIGPVVYWMHRDHRVGDNWALLYATQLARQAQRPLVAVHCLDPDYPCRPAPRTSPSCWPDWSK